MTVKTYSYYDKKTVGLDFEGLKQDMKVSDRGKGRWVQQALES